MLTQVISAFKLPDHFQNPPRRYIPHTHYNRHFRQQKNQLLLFFLFFTQRANKHALTRSHVRYTRAGKSIDAPPAKSRARLLIRPGAARAANITNTARSQPLCADYRPLIRHAQRMVRSNMPVTRFCIFAGGSSDGKSADDGKVVRPVIKCTCVCAWRVSEMRARACAGVIYSVNFGMSVRRGAYIRWPIGAPVCAGFGVWIFAGFLAFVFGLFMGVIGWARDGCE